VIDLERRRLLGGLVAAGAAGSGLAQAAEALLPGPPPSPRSAPSRAVVALAQRPGLAAGVALDPTKLRDGLGAAVARAAGASSPVEACRRLFGPRDVVGIKVNCTAGRGRSSRPEVALQLASWLQAAGVPARQIVIFDRSDRELRAGGYTVNRGAEGVRVLGVDGEFDATLRDWGASRSRFARLLVEELTALVDLPILKDHGLAGVSLGLKNWYGVIDNPSRCHGDGCNPYLPQLAAYPLLRDKLRLTVVDGAVGQCHAGPSRSPRWAWKFEGFLATTDMVAADAVGWRLLEERRAGVGLPTLAAEGREPVAIQSAARLGLGVADPAKIEMARV